MDRRKFLKSSAALAAGTLISPYVLPSGRLFAPTGQRSATHVVYVLYAGGVRQQESVLQQYLDGSQPNESTPGNIMYNMLNGQAPANKIVYGTGAGGINPIPQVLGSTLQSQGTFFPEVNAASRGHYGGLNNLLQGNSAVTQGLKQKPVNPTIFEYLRRHGGYPASKVWFVGNTIGNSVPLLNYSLHEDYGPLHGANFFAPNTTFGQYGDQYLADAKVYHPDDQLSPIYEMKAFLDNNFQNVAGALDHLGNTADEVQDIKLFMEEMFDKTANGTIAHPPIADSSDLRTVGYTCELMSWFKPNLTVVNLSGVDGCHSNYTGYLGALHRADHAVGYMWDYIQNNIPEMAGNTVIIATPECGRNLQPNAIKDENDWFAYDHSDANSLRIWTMMAGNGVPSNLSVGGVGNQIGMSTDNVPTIGEILGVKPEIMNAGYLDAGTMSLFDRI